MYEKRTASIQFLTLHLQFSAPYGPKYSIYIYRLTFHITFGVILIFCLYLHGTWQIQP